MQVATLFGGNVTSLASTITSTMDISSSSPATAPTKSVLASIEAKDEDNITKMSTKDTPSLTPNGEHLLSSISSPSIPSLYNVSSLANLASSALVENEQNLKSQQFEESKKGMDDSKKAEPEEASVGLETAATTETAKQTGKTIEADTIEATKTIVATETTVETAASSLIKTKEMEGEGENKQEKVIPMEEDISSTNENDFAILPNIVCDNPAETNIMVNLDNKKSLSPYDCPSITVSASASVNVPESLSPTSFDFNEPKNQNKVMSPSSGSSSSSPSCSLTSLSPSPACLEIHNFNACATSNKESSASHATTLLFDEAFMQHEQTQQQQQALPESSQLQNKENPSSTNPSNNIRETNGCVTSNLSDMNNLEAENLVIHHNNDDHSNNSNNNMTTDKETPFNSPQNQIERLMQQQPEDERRQMDGIEEGPLSHNQQIEFEHQQIQQHQHQQQQQHQQQHQIQSQQHHQQQQQQVNQQQTEQEEEQQRESASNDNDKLNPYSHANQYHECHRNDLNVDDISQRNIRDQHISQQNSMETSNVVDDYKLQHVPENLEMLNQMDHQQHQYQHQHHLSQNQHNMMQNQHAQQLYLHHQDQQHMMHHHQQQHHLQQQQQQQQHHLQQQQQQHQQHHHSELMAYLHHQDQQNMQQPHLIRTYQTYQQQQHRMHQLHQHPQPQSPHHQPKNTSMTCIDDLMIDELHEDPNNRYKLLSPTVKHESQDDGYETSAGDVLTPNSHTSSQHSMTPQHQMHSSNLIPPKCEDLQSTAAHNHSEPDPYNFIDDEMNSNMRMMSPSSSNGLSMVLRQQNYESPPESNRLHMEDNSQVPMNMVNPQQQQQMIDSRMQVAQSHVDSADIDMASANNGCLNNMAVPKKRGRKKKGPEEITPAVRTMVDGILKPIMPKERKKHDRFNGMPEEEVSKRTLPDHLADNLDIIIIGINPGLFAAYKGHHYAGPGNHFWKCLYLSGLTHEQMTAEEDYKLLKFGIGFTNMVERATKGSADLTRKEIKEGSRILLDKLKRFRPKIAVFNGKLIFEVFSGKKDFNFGRQQECVEGTDTYMWVMPSSSARCAQLPRAADKVPFYAALKKFRDYLNGLIPHIDDIECVFNDQKSKQCCESESMRGTGNPPSPNIGGGGSTFLSPDCLNNENLNLSYNNSNSSTPERMSIPDGSSNLNKNNVMNIMHKGSPMDSLIGSGDNGIGGCGMAVTSNMNGPTNATNLCNSVMHMSCIMDQSGQQQQQPEKKKRGRPKKIKGIDGEEGPLPQKVRNSNSMTNNNTNNNNNNNILNLTLMGDNGEMPKKKRGRPKKIKSDIGVNLSHVGANLATTNNNNCNSNSGNISAINNNNNSMDNSNSSIHNALVNKTDICAHRNSPSGLGNHQMLSINNSNHFNSQSMPQHQQQQQQQHQSLQNQRLFTSPMHSPNTVSSYCPMGINASTTPPIGNNTNSPNNPSNLVNNGPGQGYHQHQQHANSHHLQAQQQHNHNVQQHVQHQLHIPSLIYMHSPNHNPQQSSKSPHYGSSHSDLSTEISAAISSDHLAESQSASSPAMVGAVDYDRPDSIPNEEHSAHDLRFTSPTPNSGDQQQQGGGGSISAHQHYHNLYQNSGSNQSYLSGNTISNSPGEAAANKSNDNENVNYIASSRPNTSNSNNSTPQPAQNAQQTQQKRNMQISDVTSKSLSGLESLVDQIPTIADNDSANNSINSSVVGIKTDSNEDFPSPSSGGSGAGSSNSGGLGCVYMPSYSNLNSSTSSSPSAVLIATPQPSNSSILHSPHHYPDPIYSTANTCPSSTNSNNNSINNYNSIASNFSVSSLTSNNYSSNSYHSNLMAAAAASSPHHITSSASGSPMYMDPHMAVSPIYHHPYSQHAGYGAYSPVGHPPPPPHTLHMPSPNYPYAYPNTPGYPSQAGHHPSHSSPAGYLTNHPSMFDRIKPDIGYGGY